MKIDLKTTIKNLEGKEMTTTNEDGSLHPLTIGEVMANILLESNAGGKMKMFLLAQDFYIKDSVTLDIADIGLVKTSIENSNVYRSNLITGQVLKYLEINKEDQ